MIEALHSEIDLREELDELAQASVREFVKDHLADALEQSKGDPENAMELLGLWYESEHLTDLTTDAVHKGVQAAIKIYG